LSFCKKANVGTDLTIDVLTDLRITLTPLSYWPTFVSTEIPLEDLNVAQFIISERKWDVKILSSLVGPDLLDLIISIPLSLSPSSDSISCGRMGLFKLQVFETFKELVGSPYGVADCSFELIWTSKVSRRVRIFFWKIQRHRRPTCTCSFIEELMLLLSVPWCTGVDESLEHLMCASHVSANIWSGVGAILGTKGSFANINELISHLQCVLMHKGVSKVSAQLVLCGDLECS